MKIKANILEDICTNEYIIRELSWLLDITCEQVKDILIENALTNLLRYSDSTEEAAEQLQDKYLEE